MVILAITLCLLMEIATQIARVNDKRRAKRREEWLDVDDESSSSIDAAAPIGGAGSVLDPAEQVTASSIDNPESLRNQFGEPVTATPAPRSSSSARPMQQDTYGRRNGLDLQSNQQNSQTPNNGSPNNGPNNGPQSGNGPATGAAGGFFDDVL